jgi:ABC-type multidrug transport system ATPase subunit
LTPAIATHHLTKHFGRGVRQHTALDNLDLHIERGQVYGFLGQNGAGKTTTIRILLDLMRATSGTTQLLGIDPRADRTVLRRVGFLVEDAALYPFLTAQANLELLADMVGDKVARKRIHLLLERLGLAENANQRFGTFSTGMKQRLGIAAALVHDPELIILDEPTNGMDPVGIVEMRQFIRDLVDKEGKTIFLSSHQLVEVEHICDRVAVIHKGRLIQEGAVPELLSGKEQVRVEVNNAFSALAALHHKYPGHPIDETTIIINANRSQIPNVIAGLVAAGVAIYNVQEDRASLESFFLSLVGEHD